MYLFYAELWIFEKSDSDLAAKCSICSEQELFNEQQFAFIRATLATVEGLEGVRNVRIMGMLQTELNFIFIFFLMKISNSNPDLAVIEHLFSSELQFPLANFNICYAPEDSSLCEKHESYGSL